MYEEEEEVYQGHLLIDHTQVAKRGAWAEAETSNKKATLYKKQQQEPVQAIQATESMAAVAPSQLTKLSLKKQVESPRS